MICKHDHTCCSNTGKPTDERQEGRGRRGGGVRMDRGGGFKGVRKCDEAIKNMVLGITSGR